MKKVAVALFVAAFGMGSHAFAEDNPAKVKGAPTKSAEKLHVLATCAQSHGDMTLDDFVKFIGRTLDKDAVSVAGKVALSEGVTVLGHEGYKSMKEFAVLDISEHAVLEHIEKQREDAKQNPEKYKKPLVPPTQNIWEFFRDLQMGTAGGCEVLAPTRFELLKP